MTRRTQFLFLIMLIVSIKLTGQIDVNNMMNSRPVSPTESQFIKYTQIPVSEYTGIPEISVPLYNISVDGVSIPINIQYHSQGIKVSQEASWVGLGWDLRFGSIIQQINDRDDYGISDYTGQAYIKQLPDWFPSLGDGSPTTLPKYLLPPNGGAHGIGWSNPYPVNQPLPQQGFAAVTDYTVPVNGAFYDRQIDLFNQRWYDSEPDIFQANFFGESLNFSTDFKNYNGIKILNKQGYTVQKTNIGFHIISPTGNHYYFESKSIIENNSYSDNLDPGTSGNGFYEPSSIVYFLTKIVTINNKIILFNYETENLQEAYPSYSDRFITNTDTYNSNHIPYGGIDGNYISVNSMNNVIHSGLLKAWSYNRETYVFLKSISFPDGRIDFQLSDRSDINGGKKLDRITLYDLNNNLIKNWQLNYSYFDATGINGNGFTYANGIDPTNEQRSSLRLKLQTIIDNEGGNYTFTYDNLILPKKNSFAQDYWGFYNGRLSNTSLVPNPTDLLNSGLGDNGNSRSASLAFTKACMLEGITYPTGGNVQFEYESNSFSRDQFNTTTATGAIIQGCGLRIKTVSHFENSNAQPLKTVYNYTDGKLIHPLEPIRQYNYNRVASIYGAALGDMGLFSSGIIEMSANSVFSSNPLASINGVGYTQVSKAEIDGSNNTLGTVSTTFYNNLDIHNPTISTRVPACNVPSIKMNNVPDNGTLISQEIYDQQGNIKRRNTKNYNVLCSDILYGARYFYLGNLIYYDQSAYNNNAYPVVTIPQHLIGYFPVYDIETLLTSETTTEFDNNSNTFITTKSYSYDAFNQPSFTQTRGSNGEYLEEYFDHAYNYYNQTGNSLLFDNHRLTEITNKLTQKRKPNYYEILASSQLQKSYAISNGNIVVSSLTQTDQIGAGSLPKVTTFDQYDTYANPLQMTKSDGLKNSIIWDYNKHYVTAEIINAQYNDVAFTSFEADGMGNWTYSGTPILDITAPTGTKAYDLSTGAISNSNLANTQNYTITYWLKNGASCSLGGTQLTSRNNWALYKTSINGANAITISGSGTIDELRLHPSNAQMTTYTYAPLIGMTSQTDANNRITYYEYDGFNRLMLVRDQDRNILKKYCYNYQGQTTSCQLFANADQSGYFISLSCASGQTTQPIYVSIPANQYYSTISVADANAKAQQYGQTYANQYGTCVSNNFTLTYNNYLNSLGITVDLHNTTTNDYYSFSVNGSSGILGTIPAGTYDITITNSDYSTFYSSSVGCGYYGSGSGALYFYGIALSQTCSLIEMQ